MYVTQTEALTKLCVPVGVIDDGAGAVVGGAPGTGTGAVIAAGTYAGRPACIGAVCMSWRWVKDMRPTDPTTAHGYCGRAVKP